MSDLSVLSHEYKTASELSDTINRALIALKKATLHVGGEPVPPGELDASRRTLVELLETLAALLQRAGVQGEGLGRRIPATLVDRLRREHRGDLAYYLEDLGRVISLLRDHPADLGHGDLVLLDHLSAAADAETSTIFRRLMRI